MQSERKDLVRKIIGLAAVGSLIGAVVFFFFTIPKVVSGAAIGPYQPNLANGRMMFLVGDCASCHAIPGQPDRTRLGGGLALPVPFGLGTFYVPNISSDANDGIGAWSD